MARTQKTMTSAAPEADRQTEILNELTKKRIEEGKQMRAMSEQMIFQEYLEFMFDE